MSLIRPYKFYLRKERSPTYAQLHKYLQARGWKATRFKSLAHFGEQHFQFDAAAAEQLEFKHLLMQLVAEHCPQVMPDTYGINDHNWPQILGQVADKYYWQNRHLRDQREDLLWILKPSTLNNGQHIHIFQALSGLERHYLSAQRMGGEHVLQRYIAQPHLLKGHKYSIRLFVVMTNYSGAYLYPNGYYNVSLYPYQTDDFRRLESHLTNEHLKAEEPNTVQIPTQLMEGFPAMMPDIQAIMASVLTALQHKHPHAFLCSKTPRLAIVGFDFMVDAAMRVWLLEANHGPCFPIEDSHPLQAHVYQDFWQALMSDFVEPIARRNTHAWVPQHFMAVR